jgi:hypothetical protein
MAWECLQEEILCEFVDLSYSPQETLTRALNRTRSGVPSGFRIISTDRSQNKRRDGLAKVRFCKECSKEIERAAHAEFCTVKCKNRFHQKKWVKAHPEWRKPSRSRPSQESRKCLQCDAQFPPYKNRRKDAKLYCNDKCRRKYKYEHGGKEKARPRQLAWHAKQKLLKQERKAA